MNEGSLFCDNIGNTTDQLRCCFPNDQGSKICRDNFNLRIAPFSGGCPTGDCLKDCSDVASIYKSVAQDNLGEGNGQAPIRHYQTCANVPNVARYLSQGILDRNLTSAIGQNVSADATPGQLKSVTSAVTECLTATCRNARNNQDCQGKCTAVNLLVNDTTPDVDGLNSCLHSLCTGEYDSLPFADPDVVGIGVFASYIAQCMIVVILWFGLAAFQFYKPRRPRKPTQQAEPDTDKPTTEDTTSSAPSNRNKPPTHEDLFQKCILDFHKTQCYFSATLQIASLAYGIFDMNLLITFMLTPLATNGVLPIVFTYFLLHHCSFVTTGTTLLTAICWLLSSIVYWILYHSILPINGKLITDKERSEAYQQFFYKLSAIEECGGYSALAVCPHNFDGVGRYELARAERHLRGMTPVIWGFATICLLGIFASELAVWCRGRPRQDAEKKRSRAGRSEVGDRYGLLVSEKKASMVFWVATLCFLAGIGMQLSLLSIGTSLKMMDRRDWGFGQIIAVTIWVPPLVDYGYSALKKVLKRGD